MTLRAVVDSVDDIPEALRDEYVEKDGKFYLDLDDSLRTHTAILPLSNSLRNVKKEKSDLQTRLAELQARVDGLPDDFDAEKYQEALGELEALRTDPNRDKNSEEKLATMRAQYESRLQAAERKRTEEIEAKDAEIAERDATIERLIVDDGLTSALVASGVGKEYMKAAKAMLKTSVKIVRDEETGERRAVVETDLGEVTLAQYVENWSKSDEGRPFVPPTRGAGGTGDGGGQKRQEVNPWAKETRNITEQGRIVKTDPVKAERLMKAAQVPPHEIRQVLRQTAAT